MAKKAKRKIKKISAKAILKTANSMNRKGGKFKEAKSKVLRSLIRQLVPSKLGRPRQIATVNMKDLRKTLKPSALQKSWQKHFKKR